MVYVPFAARTMAPYSQIFHCIYYDSALVSWPKIFATKNYKLNKNWTSNQFSFGQTHKWNSLLEWVIFLKHSLKNIL